MRRVYLADHETGLAGLLARNLRDHLDIHIDRFADNLLHVTANMFKRRLGGRRFVGNANVKVGQSLLDYLTLPYRRPFRRDMNSQYVA